MLKMVPMSKEYAMIMSKWRYEGRCEIYSLPSWELMENKGFDLVDKEKDEIVQKVTGVGWGEFYRMGLVEA